MAEPMFYQRTTPTQLWEEQDDTAFKILKERLMNLSFGHPNYQITFFP